MLSGSVYLAGLLSLIGASPNVVIVSVDTLRADFLGCYGSPWATSPHLDGLAAESLVYDDFLCEVPLTGPSFGSFMTSRYPRTTGMTRNGLRMPAEAPTLAEAFRAAGYATFCVQSNWTLKAKLCGLDRGFDVYEEDFHKKRWGIVKPERRADEVTRVALELLQARTPDKPFFAWIHYSDPHAPYLFHREHNPSGKRRWLLKNEEKVRVKYASEVAYADEHIGRLLEALPRENTVVVFIADHGESLYEHDYLGHGRRVYQPELRIPFMVRAPGVTPGRTAAPGRGVDVAPTLLALAGLAPMPEMLGTDLIGHAPEADRVRVFETYGGAVPRLPGAHALMADASPMRQGVIQDGWKLILGSGHPELFNLREDPGELENLASRETARVAGLQQLITDWDQVTRQMASTGATLDKDDVRALEALGYVE